MSRFRGCFPILLALFLLPGPVTLAAATPPPAPSDISVGEFALRVARLLQNDPVSQSSIDAETAMSALQRAGFRFGAPPEALLTEAEMSDFFHQAGVRLQVGHSTLAVSSATADRVLAIFAGYFSARSNETLARVIIPPPGGMIARTPLPEDIYECLALPKVPECRACCLAQPGTTNKFCGRACGRAHASQNVSGWEPTP